MPKHLEHGFAQMALQLKMANRVCARCLGSACGRYFWRQEVDVSHRCSIIILSSVSAFLMKKISHNFCATIKIVFSNVCNKTAITRAGVECVSVCDVRFVLKESVWIQTWDPCRCVTNAYVWSLDEEMMALKSLSLTHTHFQSRQCLWSLRMLVLRKTQMLLISYIPALR